mgnify:CR=1 FL=1
MAFSHPNECGSIFFHRYKIVKLCIPIGIRMVDAGQAVGLAVDADEHIMTRFLILHLERNGEQRRSLCGTRQRCWDGHGFFRLNLISVRCLLNAQIFLIGLWNFKVYFLKTTVKQGSYRTILCI